MQKLSDRFSGLKFGFELESRSVDGIRYPEYSEKSEIKHILAPLKEWCRSNHIDMGADCGQFEFRTMGGHDWDTINQLAETLLVSRFEKAPDSSFHIHVSVDGIASFPYSEAQQLRMMNNILRSFHLLPAGVQYRLLHQYGGTLRVMSIRIRAASRRSSRLGRRSPAS